MLYVFGAAVGVTVAVTLGLALTLGLAVTAGEGIAGLSETTGTLGLTVGVTVAFLQPPSIASSIRASVIIAVNFLILNPPK